MSVKTTAKDKFEPSDTAYGWDNNKPSRFIGKRKTADRKKLRCLSREDVVALRARAKVLWDRF